MQRILDPRLIPQSETPLLVFWNQKGSLISDGIDWRTDIPGIAPQSHAMLCINQGKFVSQKMTIFNAYTEVPMEKYMIKGGVLTFVQLTNDNMEFSQAFTKSVQKRLLSLWWVTQYDYLGIVGQAIGLPWIHTPGLRYCSVDVLRHLVNSCPYLPKQDQLVINNIPKEINPEALWNIILQHPKTFFVIGAWSAEDGVLV